MRAVSHALQWLNTDHLITQPDTGVPCDKAFLESWRVSEKKNVEE